MTTKQSQQANSKATSWLTHLQLSQLALNFVIAIVGVSVTLGVWKNSFETRLSAVEKAAAANVNREIYNTDILTIKEALQEIKQEVRDIRKEQMEQAKREKKIR